MTTGSDTASPLPPPSAESSGPPSTDQGKRWPLIAGAATGLLVLGVALGVTVAPQALQSIPGLSSLVPSQAGGDIDEVSAELAATDALVDRLRRSLEAQSNRLAALSDETAAQGLSLARLEERLNNLEGGEGGTGATSAKSSASTNMAARIDMLTLRLGQLESAFIPLSERAEKAAETARSQKDLVTEQDRLSAAILSLEERLGGLEHSASGDRRGSLIALSFAALREGANRGRPFAAEYEALLGLLEDSQRPELVARLHTIATAAASGAPTLSNLRTTFAETSGNVLRAAAIPENANWWQRSISSLKSMVIVRPVGETAGTDAGAILARTERRLANSDLAAAIRELNKLPPSAAAAAEDWLRNARARLALDEAMAGFSAALIRAVASDSHGDAPGDAPGNAQPDTGPTKSGSPKSGSGDGA